MAPYNCVLCELFVLKYVNLDVFKSRFVRYRFRELVAACFFTFPHSPPHEVAINERDTCFVVTKKKNYPKILVHLLLFWLPIYHHTFIYSLITHSSFIFSSIHTFIIHSSSTHPSTTHTRTLTSSARAEEFPICSGKCSSLLLLRQRIWRLMSWKR